MGRSLEADLIHCQPEEVASEGFCGSRVVSRGRDGSRASDYGALEVFGHASIGSTDPYRVYAALQAQLAVMS